jgi:hypothetical protein
MPEDSPVPALRRLQADIDADIGQLLAAVQEASGSAADKREAHRRLEQARAKLNEVFDQGVARLGD